MALLQYTDIFLVRHFFRGIIDSVMPTHDDPNKTLFAELIDCRLRYYTQAHY